MKQTLGGWVLLALACSPAHAALLSRLSGQAYYDTVLNITWVADANLAQTSGWDADGLMIWGDAQAWISSLNTQNGNLGYLGVSDWRLPSADVNADTNIISCSTDTEPNCRDNEMGYMYWRNLVTSSSPSPFANLQPLLYWSGTAYTVVANWRWHFNFDTGAQQPGGETLIRYAWAVRPGDIDADGDGVAETQDNCTLVANANQRDTNGDGYGNICDPDLTNDGVVNINDLNRLKARLGITPVVDVDADLDGNGAVNINDLNRLKRASAARPAWRTDRRVGRPRERAGHARVDDRQR
jgi:hypothetical protein